MIFFISFYSLLLLISLKKVYNCIHIIIIVIKERILIKYTYKISIAMNFFNYSNMLIPVCTYQLNIQ